MRHTPVGILLAAGRGRRFDPTGAADKLLQPLPAGPLVLESSASALLHVLPRVVAVVREEGEVAERLRTLGCDVGICPAADSGMAASLVHGLRMSVDADGWLIALADMPHVRTATIGTLASALMDGADIAVPVCDGQRGNPVGFSRLHLPALLALDGDRGARAIVASHSVHEIAVDDPGIFADIDTPASLTLAPHHDLKTAR